MQQLLPLLFANAVDGRLVLTNSGRLSKLFQKRFGDVIMHQPDGDMLCIELKSERKHTGNLFLETWSNRSKFTLGWMYTLNADLLWYHFLDNGQLYIMDFVKLKKWAFMENNIYAYPEKPQNKYSQSNDSYGRIVPISALRDAIGMVEHNVSVE